MVYALFALFMAAICPNAAFANIQQEQNEFEAYEKAYASYQKIALDESYVHLKRSLSDNPEHLPSKILMGEVMALSGYYHDALAEYEEALGAGADANLIIESYIRVLMILEEFGKIIDITEKRLTPSKLAFLYSAKSVAYRTRDDAENAEKYISLAYQTAPKHYVVLNNAARFYFENGDLNSAKKFIDESLNANPNVSGTYELLAMYHDAFDQEEERVNALRKGLEINDANPVLLRSLITALSSNNQYAEAKQILQNVLATSPNDPMASLLLSWVSAQLNEGEESKSTLDKLINDLSLINKNDLATRDYTLFVSAMANYAANNFEVALGQLEQYITRNPGSFDAAKLLAELYERERSFVSAANLLEPFKQEIDEDPTMIAKLCSIYVSANQNHRCNLLLERNRQRHGRDEVFIQAEAKLLTARGKLDLALESLTKLQSSSASVMAQKAVLAINNNDLDVASKTVEHLIEQYGDNPDFLNLQGSILQKGSRLIEAEQVYLKILRKSPTHFSANYNLAHVLYLTNRAGSAQNITDKLLANSPNNVRLLLLHAKILVKRERFNLALDALSKAQAVDAKDVDVDKAFIAVYEANDDLEQALLRVNKLIKNDITNQEFIRKRAQLNFKIGRTNEAQKDLKVLFGLMSNDSQSLFDLSDVQGQFADLDGALSSLLKADKLNPDNFFINRNIAKLAINKGDLELAKKKIAWLASQSPNNPDVLLIQGDLFLASNSKSSAAVYYQRAIQANPYLSSALIGAYQLAQEGVGTRGFEKVFDELATQPSVHVFATHLLADYYFASKQYEKAKIAYVSISAEVEYKPIPMVLNNLANIYLIEEKVDAAYNFAQQAYEMIQNNPTILDTIGWITVLRGQAPQGLSLLRQAYSMNAQDPDLRYHLAFALFKLGRNAESKRELDILLSDFGDFQNRDDALKLQEIVKQSI